MGEIRRGAIYSVCRPDLTLPILYVAVTPRIPYGYNLSASWCNSYDKLPLWQ